MTTKDWTELAADYAATFRTKIASVRNTLAAVLDLREKSTLTPTSKAAVHTLTESDHGQVIFLKSGSEIVIPLGLPTWFRAELRNLHSSAVLVAPAAGVTLNAYARGGTVAADITDGNVDVCGVVSLAFSAENVAEIHGDYTVN
jgi:hypothetical protein